MSAPTSEERIERQKLDGGETDDEVHIGYRNTTGDEPRGIQFTYHDDENCARLRADEWTSDYTREAAQRQWRAPCLVCVVDGGDS